MARVMWIAVFGAMGALSRYGIMHMVHRWADKSFPWGTLSVNALGCFLFGFFWAWMEPRIPLQHHIRVMVFSGFLGAFTTYATFAFESAMFFRNAEWIQGASYVLAQLLCGIGLAFAGVSLGNLLA